MYRVSAPKPFISFASALLLALPSPAQHAPWTVDDVIMQESSAGWQLSRDGSRALWLQQKPDKEKDRRLSTLMLCDLNSAESRPLTVGRDRISAPTFSPSGDQIAFLSDREFPEGEKGLDKEEAGSQIWVLNLRGGEARPLTKIPFGAQSFRWIEENTIYLTARERLSHAEAEAKQDKDDSLVVEDKVLFADAARRLFRFEIKTRKLVRLTTNVDQIGSFAVAPDQRYAIALHNISPSQRAEGNAPPRCLLHDLSTGETTELFADRKTKPQAFYWRHDSAACFIVYPHSSVDGDDNATISQLKELRIPDLRIRDIDLNWPRGMAGSFTVMADGFLTGLANGMRLQFRHYRRQGETYAGIDLSGEHSENLFSLLKARDDDRVIYLTGAASDPDHVISARLSSAELREAREIYRPNLGFQNRNIARTKILKWRGALDEEVEGLLYYPHDYQEGQRRPLVLITHGGPHAADRDRFSERWANSPNLYCQRGAFVLKTNYHGSSSYGLAFGESIKGRYYELEIQDMFSGIKKLVEEGLVDKDRMGLVGWSNGAILSIAALTHGKDYAPDLHFEFKACAPGAGDVNWTSDYGNCAFGASFDDYYLGGAPWEIPDLYIAKSPLFRAGIVSTPTIIFFGTEDTSVPTEQGWQWFRALNKVGTDVRFVLFPGEPHGLRKLTHQKRKLEEELAWFDRYLFEREPVTAMPIKEGSPIDVAMKMRESPQHEGRYGRLHGQLLVPETVPYDADVSVGRFEVTRAQWQIYQPGYSIPAGSANYPAQGISAAAAQGYVSWLAKQTGDPWRLLTEEEFARLAKAVGPEENTLERWAGYKPSQQEASILAAEVAALGWRDALWPVGSRQPGSFSYVGKDELFFDLGGNVAEWVRADSGFVAKGRSAVTGSDDRSGGLTPPQAFIGLRVAKGPLPDKEIPKDDR